MKGSGVRTEMGAATEIHRQQEVSDFNPGRTAVHAGTVRSPPESLAGLNASGSAVGIRSSKPKVII